MPPGRSRSEEGGEVREEPCWTAGTHVLATWDGLGKKGPQCSDSEVACASRSEHTAVPLPPPALGTQRLALLCRVSNLAGKPPHTCAETRGPPGTSEGSRRRHTAGRGPAGPIGPWGDGLLLSCCPLV